jgi:hypothetical protein|tara:strand:- start:19801 stop:20016 length:216 start_codon:yes stop_codon:yes gene_type:complete
MEKPGYKTTEFWLSVAAAAVGGLVAADVIPIDSTWGQVVGLVSAALVAMGYTGARLAIKKAEAGYEEEKSE